MSAALLKEKKYPYNYPADVLAVIDALAFAPKDVKIAGSMALSSQQYAGDYDLFEIVKGKSIAAICSGLQKNIRQLMKLPDCYVGDIKCGCVPEWEVVFGDVHHGKVTGYDATDSRKRLEKLVNGGVVSEEEAADARRLLKADPTPAQFLRAQKEIRPHIVRWTVDDVLRGYATLRNGVRFTLEQGITSPAITKIDAVALVENNRFTDFSCIYSFRYKGKVLNDVPMDGMHELKKNILYLAEDGQYFKMGKRIFSLLKGTRSKLLEPLSELFNGDLGRIYSIVSDIDTLLFLLENEAALPLRKFKYEIGQFRARLGNVFETPRVNTERLLEELLRLETAPRGELARGLGYLRDALVGILNAEAGGELRDLDLLPVPASMLP
jgi:hypothetical protein